MILIVDGYNILFNQSWNPRGLTLEDRRVHLLKELSKYRTRSKIRRVIVVFDGRAGVGPYNQTMITMGLEIIYAVCAGKADQKIISLCRELQGVKVITSDRKLARKAKSFKAIILSTELFIKDLRQINKKSKEAFLDDDDHNEVLCESELDDWLDLFGLDEEIEIPKN